MIHLFKFEGKRKGRAIHAVVAQTHRQSIVSITKVVDGHVEIYCPQIMDGTEDELLKKWKDTEGIEHIASTDPHVCVASIKLAQPETIGDVNINKF